MRVRPGAYPEELSGLKCCSWLQATTQELDSEYCTKARAPFISGLEKVLTAKKPSAQAGDYSVQCQISLIRGACVSVPLSVFVLLATTCRILQMVLIHYQLLRGDFFLPRQKFRMTREDQFLTCAASIPGSSV